VRRRLGVQKVSKAGVRLRCIAEGCGYAAEPEDNEGSPSEGSPSGTPDAQAS
jgi:hypothetical protein